MSLTRHLGVFYELKDNPCKSPKIQDTHFQYLTSLLNDTYQVLMS